MQTQVMHFVAKYNKGRGIPHTLKIFWFWFNWTGTIQKVIPSFRSNILVEIFINKTIKLILLFSVQKPQSLCCRLVRVYVSNKCKRNHEQTFEIYTVCSESTLPWWTCCLSRTFKGQIYYWKKLNIE